MKIYFISDFFSDEINGGAELVDAEVIKYFVSKEYDVEKIRSFESDKIKETFNSTSYYIISNFTGMADDIKDLLRSERYSIYEHDHKYLITRDPSMFREYKAPGNAIINRSFYTYAENVFCQSKKHKEVVEKNLGLTNIVNLGCSIWGSKEVEALNSACSVKKTKSVAILKSGNQIKGQAESVDYCAEKQLDYDLVGDLPYAQFVAELAKYEKFVFFPKVLESFSRLAVEARILGCQLITNQNLGCTSELWFREKKGKELLDFIKEEQKNVLSKVESLTTLSNHEDDFSEEGITVILNSYRRPYNLELQVKMIREQTKKPTQIWLWVNDHEDNRGFDYSSLGIDRVFQNDYNWKFYGRFAAALLVDTKYIAIFDDDTIPGSRWFENCLDTMQKKEGILGSVGYIQTGPSAQQYEAQRPGWPSLTEEITQVDYVGHAWFFKREWLPYMWMEMPPTWDNAEDIHLSYTAQKFGNIQTYCPPHPKDDKSKHGSLYGYELGVDDKATSNNIAVSYREFFTQRDYCIVKSIESGWETINGITYERNSK
tara:strand:+ start:3195 stop:4823 length:1629 start_codon:yes stop_codon:yes gene_type:complete